MRYRDDKRPCPLSLLTDSGSEGNKEEGMKQTKKEPPVTKGREREGEGERREEEEGGRERREGREKGGRGRKAKLNITSLQSSLSL